LLFSAALFFRDSEGTFGILGEAAMGEGWKGRRKEKREGSEELSSSFERNTLQPRL